jgi:hypothetical protein
MGGLFRNPAGKNNAMEKFRERQARYGFSEVRSALADGLLSDVAALSSRGFEPRKEAWCRKSGDEIFQLIALKLGKGGSFGLQWGHSLSYMPHRWDSELRWHRTGRTLHWDLWESSFEEGVSVDGLHGEECARRDLCEVWSHVEVRMDEWVQATSTLEGVLDKARELMERATASCRVPHPALVYAFTLARMNRKSEAVEMLDSLLVNAEFSAMAKENLTKALGTLMGS